VHRAEPEIGQLELAVGVQQDVLRLDVAVVDAVAVARRERRQELLEVPAR
jgi:hypothetical protein